MTTNRKESARMSLEKMGAKETTFASLMKTYRLTEDMTLAELSKKLKISVSHLSDIENERKFVSIERAKEFARRLGDSEKYFVLIAVKDLLRRADCNYEVELRAIG
jgi:transcriptional regulator with XRE-family HTH domain